MPFDNETVVGLANKYIINRESDTAFVYIHGAWFPYSISEFVKPHLTNQMLDIPENLTEKAKQKIIQNRPDWAKEKSRRDNLFNSIW